MKPLRVFQKAVVIKWLNEATDVVCDIEQNQVDYFTFKASLRLYLHPCDRGEGNLGTNFHFLLLPIAFMLQKP